jgi:hypothetical protein
MEYCFFKGYNLFKINRKTNFTINPSFHYSAKPSLRAQHSNIPVGAKPLTYDKTKKWLAR